MKQYLKILRNFSKPHWYDIIELIKCSEGLSVGELSEHLGMSYMGVKKHCLAMQKLGYLDTWRKPKDVGRPEKLYRLTDRLAPLFPQIGNDVCFTILEAASQLESNAAEKLLLHFFRSESERLEKLVTAESVREKADQLAAARTAKGYFSSVVESEKGHLSINEFHNPLQPLFEKYPTLERMEIHMFEKLLQVGIDRTATKVSGLTRYRFDLFPR